MTAPRLPENHSTYSVTLDSLEKTQEFAELLSKWLQPADVIYLYGDLGAGKTTLTRCCLQAMGVNSAITSPTYTLVEPYALDNLTLNHLDLYRLAEPEELEYLGIRDIFTDSAITWIEWPDKGDGYLPPPTVTIQLEYADLSATRTNSDDIKTSSNNTILDADKSAHNNDLLDISADGRLLTLITEPNRIQKLIRMHQQ